MNAEDTTLNAILAAYDCGGLRQAYEVADDSDVPYTEVDSLISYFR